jgi:hypothetical protein
MERLRLVSRALASYVGKGRLEAPPGAKVLVEGVLGTGHDQAEASMK